MKELLVFLAFFGMAPLHVDAQPDSKTNPKGQQNPKLKGHYNEIIIDTFVSTPDGGTARIFSYSFSNNGNDGDSPTLINMWGTPTFGVRHELEQAQDQIIRQVDEDALRFNRWINQQMLIRSEKVREYWREQKKAVFSQVMELTPEESKLFWPLYTEFSDKKEVISEKRKEINNKLRKATLHNIDTKEADALTKEYVNLITQETNLQQEYHRKYKAILKPNKLLMVYKAEDAFKLLMLQNRGHEID